MKNAECTPLSWGEEMELMKAFPNYLRDRDEALARKFFEPYVFFKAAGKTSRRCVCTSCMEGFFVDKEIRPDFFRVKHRGLCECPNCGQRATLLAMGKFTNFQQLTSCERAVQITAYKDWLLIQAGRVFRRFDPEDLGGYLTFTPYKRYALAPGRRAGWQQRTYYWFDGGFYTDGLWERMERIRSPFQSRPYEAEMSYIPMGLEYIEDSPMKYCQYERWFYREFGGRIGDLDWMEAPFLVAHLIRYLAEYTRRPQMEMLIKLGFYQVVSDLVIHKKEHRDILKWDAANPADFFRLSKADFRLFLRGLCDFADLKEYRRLQKLGLVSNVEEFSRRKNNWKNGFDLTCMGARLAGVSLERAERYLWSMDSEPAVSAQLWKDYLDAAVKLKYDLTRDDVRMPKDLAERHDQATSALRAAEDEKTVKRYMARFLKLTAQFGFSADGLCVVVPKGVNDIVREGKILRHCVGGYADRHMQGMVTILFLRKESAPSVPYVTIEMTTENNCQMLKIKQIHGYQNEKDGRKSPEEIHGAFLDTWLDWVHAGSPRDLEGKPIVKKKEVSVA